MFVDGASSPLLSVSAYGTGNSTTSAITLTVYDVSRSAEASITVRTFSYSFFEKNCDHQLLYSLIMKTCLLKDPKVSPIVQEVIVDILGELVAPVVVKKKLLRIASSRVDDMISQQSTISLGSAVVLLPQCLLVRFGC